jgi:hypothetical protein
VQHGITVSAFVGSKQWADCYLLRLLNHEATAAVVLSHRIHHVCHRHADSNGAQMSASHIIAALRQFKTPNVFNPWTDRDPLDLNPRSPEQRAARLAAHFDCQPKFLLIGEAPGYQGCHFSGIPFTNESLVCAGNLPRIGQWERFTSRRLPWREPSATIVWKALHEHEIADQVVMWNAFAFHPHKDGEPYTNRAPTRAELESEVNVAILTAVMEYFRGVRFVPVGKVAAAALKRLGFVSDICLRHPSMGGATEFRTGLAKMVGS